ncbi:hypothetical protein H5410_003180 [Solanum commersonii]|uniref:Uncharacterized protein n=1 Tax=Solanum commersonii TaxID=4109 RepID=A0A9J6B4Y2_SOLCO|nr:hypothetical protein H5410_003180 [Solanum commersonii]
MPHLPILSQQRRSPLNRNIPPYTARPSHSQTPVNQMNSPATFRAPFPLLQTFSVTIGGNTFYATQAPPQNVILHSWVEMGLQIMPNPRSSDNSLEQPHDSSQGTSNQPTYHPFQYNRDDTSDNSKPCGFIIPGTIIAPSFPSPEELSANRRSESKHRGVRGGPSTHVRNKNIIMIPKDIKYAIPVEWWSFGMTLDDIATTGQGIHAMVKGINAQAGEPQSNKCSEKRTKWQML